MTTRAEIEMDYRIEAGRIANAGAFEMQPIWTPYFWSLVLDGSSESEFYGADERQYSMFKIDDDDRKQFPELEDIEIVIVSQDANGFIYAQPNTLERWIRIKEQDEPVDD